MGRRRLQLSHEAVFEMERATPLLRTAKSPLRRCPCEFGRCSNGIKEVQSRSLEILEYSIIYQGCSRCGATVNGIMSADLC